MAASASPAVARRRKFRGARGRGRHGVCKPMAAFGLAANLERQRKIGRERLRQFEQPRRGARLELDFNLAQRCA